MSIEITPTGNRNRDPSMTRGWHWLIRKRWTPHSNEASLLFRKSIDPQRLLLLNVATLILTFIATFRSFGFDLNGPDSLRSVYPFVADGWGIWYWLAGLGLGFTLFLFIVNFFLARQILHLAWPKRTGTLLWSVAFIIVTYSVFWFLFGQARWGTAIALIAAASISGSVPLICFAGAIATLIHKAAAGGVLLVLCWILLSRMKYGLVAAIIIAAGVSYIVQVEAQKILILAGYSQYLNWEKLPDPATPLKYYYFLAVLSCGLFFKHTASVRLLILTLLFLPFSYFIVFAGRSYQLYALILLTIVLTGSMPRILTYFLLVPFVFDILNLIFRSGFFLST